MKAKSVKLGMIMAGIFIAMISSSCVAPNYVGAGVGFTSAGYGYGALPVGLIRTSNSRFFYDPYRRFYYDVQRKAYYNPINRSYFSSAPRRYKAKQFPNGWSGRGTLPGPSFSNNRAVRRNNANFSRSDVRNRANNSNATRSDARNRVNNSNATRSDVRNRVNNTNATRSDFRGRVNNGSQSRSREIRSGARSSRGEGNFNRSSNSSNSSRFFRSSSSNFTRG